MEEIKSALAEYDAYIEPCPINNPKSRRVYRPHDKCERCGARADQNCGLEVTASYYLVKAIRRIVHPTEPEAA